jgi:uncharacterized protein
MYFKRKIYDKIKQWKDTSNGKTALLIEGARRVGKSTVVEEFAKNEYDSYILIDFSNVNSKVTELFNDIHNLNYFFSMLQLYFAVDLVERKSLIIFDEVQLYPKARQAIKHLVEDGRYDYIETGSLISLKKNVQDILIPSEERSMNMHPMDFEEFLWALGQKNTYNILKEMYMSNKNNINDSVHQVMMKTFRLYMLIGGMPQAIDEYLNTYNFKNVDMVKRDIIKLYENDLAKIDSTGRLKTLFEAIPSQLNKNTKGYQMGKILNSYNLSEDTTSTLISELKESKIVNVAYRTNDPNIDLSAYINLDDFKLYLLDTGLFVTLQFKNQEFTQNTIYEKLLTNNLPVNLGYLYENVVAQILVSNEKSLFYYTFKNENQKCNYEIDFIITKGNKICPIEVKSSNYRKHESIDKFYEKYSSRIANRYIIHTKGVSKDKDILCLPVYLTSFLFE